MILFNPQSDKENDKMAKTIKLARFREGRKLAVLLAVVGGLCTLVALGADFDLAVTSNAYMYDAVWLPADGSSTEKVAATSSGVEERPSGLCACRRWKSASPAISLRKPCSSSHRASNSRESEACELFCNSSAVAVEFWVSVVWVSGVSCSILRSFPCCPRSPMRASEIRLRLP